MTGDTPPGFCHFPEYDEEYFKQLTAEQLVAHRTRRGYVLFEWAIIPGRQNHVLDARVYARGVEALVGLDRFQESDWAAHEAVLRPAKDQGPSPIPPPAAAKPSWITRRPGWVEGGRS